MRLARRMAGHIIRGRMRRTLTLLLAGAAALAGCGGDAGGDGPPAMVDAGKPLVVAADEYEFRPANFVLDAPSKQSVKVRIQLENAGAQAHDLRVLRVGEDVGGTPIFGPGQTKSATVDLVAGEYQIICSVADHEQLGMKGKLTVK